MHRPAATTSKTLPLGYAAMVLAWAAVCMLARFDKNTWPVLMFACPFMVFFVALSARPWVPDSANDLLSNDRAAAFTLLSRLGVPTLAALGVGVAGWMGAFASWLMAAERGAGPVVFGRNAYLGWAFSPIAAGFSALLASVLALLVVVPAVAGVTAVRLRSVQPREAMRLSAVVGTIMGCAATLTAHFVAFGIPGDTATDRFDRRLQDLGHEVDLLVGRTPPDAGLWGSVLAWVGLALFAVAVVLLSKARRLPR